MNINFFEEFSTEDNLKKVKLIDFHSVIYVATKSIKEFLIIKKKVNKLNPKIEVAYWPILKKSYWISPFSYTSELNNIYKELFEYKKKLKVLIDLELPFLNSKLFFLNIFSFFSNKRLIKKLFLKSEKLNIEILAAQYPVSGKFMHKLLRYLGVSYQNKKYHHKKIIMYYSSMLPNKYIKRKIKQDIKEAHNVDLEIGLGTIATGILGNEPILTPKELDADLLFCKKTKIKTVVIFRLGGLNKQYIKIIKKY